MSVVKIGKRSCAVSHKPVISLLWMIVLLISCSSGTEQDRTTASMKFSVPGGTTLLRTIDPGAIQATLTWRLDNNEAVLMTTVLTRVGQSDEWKSEQVPVNPGVAYSVRLTWAVMGDGGDPVVYAHQDISFTGTDSAQAINLSDEDYHFDNYDHDNNGMTNFDELKAGTLLMATSSDSPLATPIPFAVGQRTDATAMNELDSLVLSFSTEDANGEINRYEWQPDPVEQGALDQCAGIADFNISLAANSLQSACTTTADCVVTIEEQQGGGDDLDFVIKTPALRAPVGVTYQLDVIDNDGVTESLQTTYCLVAINEAPDAVDDSFTVLEGNVLTVSAQTGELHLLTNDVQDDHVANTSLRVLPTLATAPLLATAFTFDSDGGFTYTAPLLTDNSVDSAIDTFVYSITDSTHISNATVTVTVVARNDPPEQIATIPVQEFVAGVEFESDLSTFFIDAEGSMLSFAISAGALPASGGLTLSVDGTLGGTAELIDEGWYPIRFIVSDGIEQITAAVNVGVLSQNDLPE